MGNDEAKAGVQTPWKLDSGFRRNDGTKKSGGSEGSGVSTAEFGIKKTTNRHKPEKNNKASDEFIHLALHHVLSFPALST